MAVYTATKQLGGIDDLTVGLGTVAQPRQSGTKSITKVNVSELQGVYTVNTVAEFNAIDPLLLGTIKIVHVTDTNQSWKWNGTAWVLYNSGGQFHDIGDTQGKSVPFVVEEASVEDIVVTSGTNSFAIDSITIPSGGSLTIEPDAVFKVL